MRANAFLFDFCLCHLISRSRFDLSQKCRHLPFHYENTHTHTPWTLKNYVIQQGLGWGWGRAWCSLKVEWINIITDVGFLRLSFCSVSLNRSAQKLFPVCVIKGRLSKKLLGKHSMAQTWSFFHRPAITNVNRALVRRLITSEICKMMVKYAWSISLFVDLWKVRHSGNCYMTDLESGDDSASISMNGKVLARLKLRLVHALISLIWVYKTAAEM